MRRISQLVIFPLIMLFMTALIFSNFSLLTAGADEIHLDSISISPSAPSVALGQTRQFTVTGNYSDGSHRNLTTSSSYTSSNVSVATVNTGGLATSLALGTTTITAEYQEKYATATLIVTPPVLSSISISPTTTSVAAGLTQQFSVTGRYSDNSTQDLTATSTYTSSNVSVATVNASGVATAVTTGIAAITASNGGFNATSSLTVTAPVLSAISITPSNATVAAGFAQQYTVIGTYSDRSTQDLTTSSTYTSLNTSIATITSTGLATGMAAGSSIITASNGGFNATANLTVTPPVLSNISVTPATASVAAGLTQQLIVTGTYSDNSTKDLTATSTYTSSNTSLATINASGVATGLATGNVTVTASNGGYNATANLTVTPPILTGLSISPLNASIAAGLTQQFSVTGVYSDNSTQDITSSSAFTSSNTGVATINASGTATGVAVGTATVSVSNNGFSATTNATVTPPVLTSIAITPANASIAAGLTQQYIVTGTYSDNSTQNLTNSSNFISSNISAATISANGIATGVSTGSTTITASNGAFSATANLSVTPPVLSGIAITPVNASVAAGLTQQYTVTGTYSDNSTQNLTVSSTFVSSNTAMVSINASGTATGIAIGTTSITASNGGFTATANLTVTSPVLTGIAITPATASVAAGLTQQFSVIGTYSDNSTQDVTSSSAFTSSNTGVTTINASGTATGNTVGTTTITATSNGFNATSNLTIISPVLTSITITPATASIAAGLTQQFVVTGTYSDNSTQDITVSSGYISSNTGVATVNAAGRLTASTSGVSAITATYGGFNATSVITVIAPVLTGISITPVTASMAVGATQQFAVSGTYSDNSTQDLSASSTFASSNTSVATVNASGVVTAVAAGTATITASNGGFNASSVLNITVIVNINPNASDSYEPDNNASQAVALVLNVPQAHTIYPAMDIDWVKFDAVAGNVYSIQVASTSSTASVYFSLYDTDGMTWRGSGNIWNSLYWKAQKSGTHYLELRHYDYWAGTGSYNITVQEMTGPIPVASMSIWPTTVSRYEWQTYQYYVDGRLANGNYVDLTSFVTYSSLNPAVATVDDYGLAKAVSRGSATIDISYNGLHDSSVMTVLPVSVQRDSYEPDDAYQQSKPITVDGGAQTHTISPPEEMDWVKFDAVAGMDYEIRTSNLSTNMDTYIQVNDPNGWWAGWDDNSGGGLASMITLTATASGTYYVGIGHTNYADGMGQYDISVKHSFQDVSVTPTGNRLLVAKTQQLKVLGTTINGSIHDITSIVSFVSANSAVASVNQNGLITAVAKGYTTVNISIGNASAVAQVLVGNTTADFIPADPATKAPVLDNTVSTNISSATSFLYTGSNPTQMGLAAKTINPVRTTVIRGKVMDNASAPLSGVLITVLGHPEYGSTLSRVDGSFDMVVNGGSFVTIDYEKTGYLPVQRQVDAQWQSYTYADDAMMIQLDTRVTTVDLASATAIQVAQGNTVTDADGTRKATLFFAPSTSATMVMPDGTTQPLTTLNVRATEYTVGPNGPKSMPAALPPTSGYTYAVELSVDEAIASGAASVQFNQPVYTYVENFLNFPVGGIVPVGYYDRQQGQWIPSTNGVVINVLSITNGMADIDIDGSGIAATPASMSVIGMTDAERTQIATLYTASQSLWRVPVTHFSPWDCNWPYGPPPDATDPDQPPGDDNGDICPTAIPPTSTSGTVIEGSIIECENQILGEKLSVAGTPFTLNYLSTSTPGRITAKTINIQLSGATLPSSLREIELVISTPAGDIVNRFPPNPNQSYTFTWDGKDAYGRLMQGEQAIVVKIGYTYGAVYYTPAQFTQSFAAFSGIPISRSRGRQEITLWQQYNYSLGTWDARANGIGGWTLSPVHTYDIVSQVLHKGNGGRITAKDLSKEISLIRWGGGMHVDDIFSITTGSDGTYYYGYYDWDNDTYDIESQKIDLGWGGDISTIFDPALGWGSLHTPKGLVFDSKGNLYILDEGSWPNDRLLKRSPDGKTIQLAILAHDWYDGAVAVGPDDSVYYTDGSVIRKIDVNGVITAVAGNGSYGYGGDGGSATAAQLWSPKGITVDKKGNLYIADSVNNRIRKVTIDGIITTVAGSGIGGFGGDGGAAIDAQLSYPSDVAVDSVGNLYIADESNGRIRMVNTMGNIMTVVGGGMGIPTSVSLHPLDIQLNSDIRISIDKQDNLLFLDRRIDRIYKVQSTMPGFSLAEYAIPSEDGSELYKFDARGLHMSTADTKTGAILYSFGYDVKGKLISITNKNGDITTIQRNASGVATTITAPNGQVTTLTINANGYMTALRNPANEVHSMTYTMDGLLTSFADPKGNTSVMTYDAMGRLINDQNAGGGSSTLSRTEIPNGHITTLSSVMGRTTTYLTEKLTTGAQQFTMTSTTGTKTTKITNPDGSTIMTTPDGTVTISKQGADPRFGMKAPITASVSVTTPGGLTNLTETIRNSYLLDPNNPLSLYDQLDTVTVNGKTSTTNYTALPAASKQVTATSPMGKISVKTFDDLGQVIQQQVGNLNSVSYTYDTKGRLIAVSVASRTTTYSYNALNQLVLVTDPASHTTSYVHDLVGRLTHQVLPDGRVIGYSYDANGNLTGVTPPGKTTHGFTYTNVDLTSQYLPPALGTASVSTTYAYNLDKQLTTVTRPDGQAISMGYDAGGRLSAITLPTGSVSYMYNASTGNVVSVTAPNSEITGYTYDGSLVTSQSWTGAVNGSVGYVYNNDFKVASESVNGAHIAGYTYDNDGQMTMAGSMSIAHDAQNGLLTGTTLAGITTANTYNSMGELTGYNASSGATALYDAQYTRDNLGRITQKVETINGVANTYAYSYDTAGRLITVSKNNVVVNNYTYDSNGNRLNNNASYDAQDRLLSYGDNTYTYTANGELQSKVNASGTTQYVYDVMGNLTSLTLPNGTLIEYVIDAQNRKIGKKVNGVLTQGWLYENQLNPVAELDGAGNVVSRFVYGTKPNVPDYMIKGGIMYRIISDNLGSPKLAVDASTGAVMQQMEYDEYGNVLFDSNPGFQPFGFAGGIYDKDTGLVRFGARDYDADNGRWTAKDPILFKGGSANLYGYVLNDPVNLVDPNGNYLIPTIIGATALAAWTTTCYNIATSGAETLYTPYEDKKRHCYASCVFNRCMLFSPIITLGGGVVHELMGNGGSISDDGWHDIRADIYGILASYDFSSCAQNCNTCPVK